jgi:hypothetical protein
MDLWLIPRRRWITGWETLFNLRRRSAA